MLLTPCYLLCISFINKQFLLRSPGDYKQYKIALYMPCFLASSVDNGTPVIDSEIRKQQRVLLLANSFFWVGPNQYCRMLSSSYNV